MPSSFSTDLKLELMVTGENAGTWGTKTNTNLNLLQQAIAGYQDISIAGGAQTTALTMDNAAISNARNAVVKLTGTITGNQIVTVPNGIEKTYIVSNGTTGAFTVEFKTASGTGPTFSTTDKGIKILFADGTNVVDVNANLSASSFPQINDSNGNEEIKFTTTASAVNELTITNSATGNAPEIAATGDDTNIDLKLTPKGTGKLNLDGIKFPNADGTANQVLKTDGSGVLSFATVGLVWQSVQTTGFTAVKGNAYPCNTTSAAFTVTLPATPSAGDQIQLVDYAGTFDTNNLILNPNGNKIESGTSNFELTGEREGVTLTYIDSTQGWIATSGINEGTDALNPVTYSVDFLVIAGGGGAGSAPNAFWEVGGGGGAGGYRTSTQTVTQGTVITVTVGDGGAGGNLTRGSSGSNSSISGTGLTTITSAGGGAGAGGFPVIAGGSGGSGGGGSANGGLGGSGNTPNTSPSQGNNGGNGAGAPIQNNGGGGGGGGSGGVGGNGTQPNGGAGGGGTASSITGSSVTRAGGGGGSFSDNSGGSYGAGGSGGGGTAGSAGDANTGSGGGAVDVGTGGAGGKGVVILAMPLAKFSGTTTGSPTASDDGTTKRLVFNGDGSYTA